MGSQRPAPPPPKPLAPLIDAHTHLDACGAEDADDVRDILDRAEAVGVEAVVTIADDLDAAKWAVRAAEWDPRVFAAVALHPTRAQTLTGEARHELERLAAHPRVVAIGETGLDYYRLRGDLEWQRERFRVHIRAARAVTLPLIIHTRAASEDTLAIMRDEIAAEAGGVMHCFTETREVARAALDMGFYISFSGIVTFRNAQDLRDVACFVPLDRMLVETDSPYLAPVPHRGRTNEPAYVRHVAEEIARLHGIDLDAVASRTSDNFFRLFNRATRSSPES